MSKVVLRIKKIKAQAFRGIGQELNLNLAGKSFVLYGDNGTGKSSIIEAVEYALTGRVHSIENRGQRVSLARHGTHVTMQRAETNVEVTLSNKLKDSVVSVPSGRLPDDEEVAAFLKGCHRGTFILRRDKLLNFIEAVDRDRYEALRPFLGLEQYERLEDGIKQAKETLERKASSTEAAVDVMRKQFLATFDIPETKELSDKEICEHINEDAKAIKLAEVNNIEEAKNLLEHTKGQIAGLGDISLNVKLVECRSSLQEYIATIPNIQDLGSLGEKEQNLVKLEEELKGGFYEEVLKLGAKWIDEENESICPLCEKPFEDKQILLDRIQLRLDEHASIIKARSDIRSALSSVRTVLNEFKAAHERALTRWIDAGFKESNWPFAETISITDRLLNALGHDDRIVDLIKYQEILDTFDTKDIKPKSKEVEKKEILSAFDSKDINLKGKEVEKAIQTKENNLPKSKDAELLIRLQNRCTLYTKQFPDIRKQFENHKKLESKLELLVQLHDQAVKARKQTCREIFAEIGQDIGAIYEYFHPEEGLGNFHIAVREVGIGSAVLKGSYPYRNNEDPRGFYSEAHLDTLGLAVFLALRKREEKLNPSFKLVILDDILTSVDAPHRARVASYLLTELSRDHQVIITTHSRPLFEWITHLQSVHGLRGQFVNKRILDWSFEKGPQIVNMEDDYEFLRINKATMPHEITAVVAGRLLENILQEVRYSLKLAVEAKRDERYTIGDLWPKFMSTCKKRLKGFWADVETICTRLNETAIIRNWETHSNEWAKELSREEALLFINGVVTLYEKTFCQTCSTFISAVDIPQGAVSCKSGCIFYKPLTT